MSIFLPINAVDHSANDNRDVNVVPALIALSKTTKALLTLRLSAIGLKIGQDEALMALSPVEPVEINTVADRLCIRVTTAATVLRYLAEKGLVSYGAGLKPGEPIRLTPAGAALQHKIRQVHSQLEQDLIAPEGTQGPLLTDLTNLQKRLSSLIHSVR